MVAGSGVLGAAALKMKIELRFFEDLRENVRKDCISSKCNCYFKRWGFSNSEPTFTTMRKDKKQM